MLFLEMGPHLFSLHVPFPFSAPPPPSVSSCSSPASVLLVLYELFFQASARELARIFVRSNRACAHESTTLRQQLLADAAAVRSARGWTADPAELVAGTAGADIAEPLPAPAAQEVSEEKEGTDPS